MRPNKYSLERSQLIEDLSTEWVDRIEVLQRLTALRLVEFLTPRLDTSDGRLTLSANNLASQQAIRPWYRAFIERNSLDTARWLITGLDRIFGTNIQYFAGLALDIVGTEAFDQVVGGLERQAWRSFGFTQNDEGQWVLGDGLAEIFNSTDPIRKAETYTFASMSASTDMLEFIEGLRVSVDGGDKRGELEKHYQQQIVDPFQKFDRQIGVLGANELALNYAIYQGGIIATTREWCEHRDNKVFSRLEISRFGSFKDKYGGYSEPRGNNSWKGKCPNDFSYNPFADLGGCNCRHQLDWISDGLARILLKDQTDEPSSPFDVTKRAENLSTQRGQYDENAQVYVETGGDFMDRASDTYDEAVEAAELWARANPRDAQAVSAYTHGGDAHVNHALRFGVPYDGEYFMDYSAYTEAKWQDLGYANYWPRGAATVKDGIEAMDRFLESAPKYEGTVYRGLNVEYSTARQYLATWGFEGGVLQEDGYMSTTFDEPTASNFAQQGGGMEFFFQFQGGQGVPISGISNYGKHSFGNDEYEVLFPRGTQWLVTNVDINGPYVTVLLEQINR